MTRLHVLTDLDQYILLQLVTQFNLGRRISIYDVIIHLRRLK